MPFGLLLLWPINLGLAVERWRARHGAHIGDWLEAIGELEALSSLATYAFERPRDPFATIIARGDGDDDGRGARIHGSGLRHPLLEDCVANDIALDAETRALIISGSNMSGKSTYLRTVGTNVVLALAGAPVRAQKLELTPLHLGATLRIEDSLAAGRSRFFAELARLKQLVDVAERSQQRDGDAHAAPLLFLLDEVLAGTNSGDRQRGAMLLIDALLSRGAIGLVTTHDLAIAESARERGGIENRHFTDELGVGPDGAPAPTFDYQLRDGIVEGSNALALMRAIGLTQAT
ncbi:MAG: hypothetical protein KC503_42510 [Myxococcales bacterium]|nr:hypothetical protein [Myxococcales bacterium]